MPVETARAQWPSHIWGIHWPEPEPSQDMVVPSVGSGCSAVGSRSAWFEPRERTVLGLRVKQKALIIFVFKSKLGTKHFYQRKCSLLLHPLEKSHYPIITSDKNDNESGILSSTKFNWNSQLDYSYAWFEKSGIFKHLVDFYYLNL